VALEVPARVIKLPDIVCETGAPNIILENGTPELSTCLVNLSAFIIDEMPEFVAVETKSIPQD
jgi:hypothetical protein